MNTSKILTTSLSPGRFHLTRGGILNIWQYDQQTFEFRDGRLLLRGENGSGKTKALELLLPFLLDADLSPNRLDPAGANAKSMKDNLLDDEQGSRIGYAWIEFGRISAEGQRSFVTLGAGIRASQSAPGADPWYFVTTQRIGHDLKLEDETGQPLTRDRLRTSLGAHGKICDSATEYKSHVDQTLFGLGKERYQALVELLIQLRKPQLSKSLDPELLAKALSQSLPPLDEPMISRIADAFNELEKQQRALAEVQKSRDLVGSFLETYEGYAKILSRSKSARLVGAVHALSTANEKLAKLQTDHSETAKAIAVLDETLARLKREEAALSGKIDALKSSPEAKQAANIEQLGEFAKSLREEANRIQEEVTRLSSEIERDTSNIAALRQRHQSTLDADGSTGDEVKLLASMARAEPIHEVLTSRKAGAPLSAEIEKRWEHGVRTRLTDLGALEAATEQVREAEHTKKTRESEVSGADEKHRLAGENAKAARSAVNLAREAAEATASEWRATTTRLKLSEEAFEEVLAAFEADALASGLHATILRGEAAILEDACAKEQQRLAAEKAPHVERRRMLAQDIARWRAEKDNPPQAPSWTRSDRQGRAGAPFYRLVDFDETVHDIQAAALEGALAGSGLLDAWLLSDGRIDPQTFDVYALAQERTFDDSLARFLKPVDNDHVPVEIIRALLRSIRVLPTVTGNGALDGLVLGEDGTWSVGVFVGKTSKSAAEHVGELARERSRRRKIQDAESEIEKLDIVIGRLDDQIAAQGENIKAIRAELSAFPSMAPLSAKYTDLAKAQGIEDATRLALIEAQRRVGAAREELDKQQQRRRALAREKGLEDVIDVLSSVKENLRVYQQRCMHWFRLIESAVRAKEEYAESGQRLARKQERLDDARSRLKKKDAEAAGRESELATLQKIAGKAVEKLTVELETATAKLAGVRGQQESKGEARTKKVGELNKLEAHIETATEAVDAAGKTRRDLASALETFRATGLIELALGLEVPTITEEELADLILSKTTNIKDSAAALEEGTNLVHPRYQALTRDLPQDYSVSGSQVHDAFVVTISRAGKESTARQMHLNLRAEAEVQSALLEKHEAEVIQKYLFGEVSGQIKKQIREANDLVERMNKQLEAHPTASGLKMKLQWNKDPELGAQAERALTLIRKSQNLLTEQETRTVTAFLQDCRKRAREEMPTAPQSEQLMRALDYRQWYRFDLYWKKPGQNDFAKLTKKSHATGSAGEKAVALYLPLFSAAAAHFDSARETAPRLVLLDEVFAGVDQTTRGSCMGLLVAFDLDVMMTAFSEWGCYKEVPGLAIYHLERDPAVRGVLATSFWWDGNTRRPLEPEALS